MKFLLILAATASLQLHAQVDAYRPHTTAKDKGEAIDQDNTDVLQRHMPFILHTGVSSASSS